VVHPGSDLDVARAALREVSDGDATADVVTRRITAPVSGGSTVLVDAVRVLDQAGVAIDDLALRRPTLDDVFLTLTGHAAEDVVPADPTKGRGRGRKEA
jgi:ABC-2 type transport system ATP-binding protein